VSKQKKEKWIHKKMENERMNRNDIIKNLKARFGDKCYLCGTKGVPLSIDHIVPLSEGGDNSLENLRLVCLKCNIKTHEGIREFDFVNYLFQLLKLNRQFRNVRTEVRFGAGRDFVADLVAEEKIDNQWLKIVIECKVASSYTRDRLLIILGQLNSYRRYIDSARLIFAFPGELHSSTYQLFRESNLEIWDLTYISNRFKQEIPKVYHPVLQSMLMAQKPTVVPPERRLIQDLKALKPGKADWSKYQKLIGQVLERLFCPPLLTPISELPDAPKINRRDFILPNYSEDGFWAFIRSQYSGDYIVADAKNYSRKVKKRNVLQISNYLKKHGAGLFGLIICRNGGDNSCIQTLREAWAIDRKLIIVLTDDDIEKMLIEKSSGRNPEIIVRQKIEDFRLAL